MDYLFDTNICVYVPIAAQALSRDIVLITNNTREFQRIEAFKVEDWVE